jgi:cyclase
VLLNSIDRDGAQTGYDLELIRNVSSAVTVPVVACGGAGSVQDMRAAVLSGASAAAAGSLFVFRGPHRAVLINYPSPEELSSAFTDVSS